METNQTNNGEISRPWLSREEDQFVSDVVKLVALSNTCDELLKSCNEYCKASSPSTAPEDWEDLDIGNLKGIAEWIDAGKPTDPDCETTNMTGDEE